MAHGVYRSILSYVTLNPLAFLTVVSVAVYFIRFFLGKTPSVILLSTIGLSSWAQEFGVHPGVLLITILMANESWFFYLRTMLIESLFTVQTAMRFHMRKLGNSWWYDALLTF
jgi:uncharacterized membrane protein YdjX (TVP38/TMEM64 family)